MKIGMLALSFKEENQYKDQGQIMMGLQELGMQSVLVSLKDASSSNLSIPLEIKFINQLTDLIEVSKSLDCIIVYIGLNPDIFMKLKQEKKFLIYKMDSDGRFCYNSDPQNRLVDYYSHHFKGNNLEKFFQSFAKRYAPNFIKNKFYLKRIEMIEYSDRVVIESPDAANNLSFFLTKNGRPDLINKIHIIPNPVTPDLINSEIETKENIVISIGRWNDIGPKNPEGLVQTLNKFLSFKTNWKAVIIGPGENIIEMYMNKFKISNNIRQRINITGSLPHEKIKDYLLKSKIFFMPSRWESFGIAAAEALCCGCTVVGSPIESLRYLTNQGFSGNVSYSLDKDALFGTLVYESNKWENNEIDYIRTANYWRKKLNRQSIAKEFIRIIQENEGKSNDE